MLYLLIRELTAEGSARQILNLGRREAVAQEVVDEEVVQGVWSNQIFGLLCDISLAVGRQKLRAYRRIDDVA